MGIKLIVLNRILVFDVVYENYTLERIRSSRGKLQSILENIMGNGESNDKLIELLSLYSVTLEQCIKEVEHANSAQEQTFHWYKSIVSEYNEFHDKYELDMDKIEARLHNYDILLAKLQGTLLVWRVLIAGLSAVLIILEITNLSK